MGNDGATRSTKKQSKNEFYVRIQDAALLENLYALQEAESLAQKRKVSMNTVIQAVLRRGLPSMLTDKKPPENTLTNIEKLLDSVNKNINYGFKSLREKLFISMLNEDISEKMIAAILKILLSMNGNEPVDNAFLERGMYDTLPQRLQDYKTDELTKIADNFHKPKKDTDNG